MKILFFASDNNKYSGAFLSLCYLVQNLQKQYDLDCRIVVKSKGSGTEILDEMHLKYTMIDSYSWVIPENCNLLERVKAGVKVSLNNRSLTKIESLIQSYQPDIIHLNTSYTYIGAVAAFKYGIPVIWHIREFLEEDQNKTIIGKDRGAHLFGHASRIVCISKTLSYKYQRLLGNSAKIVTIYNGIDTGKYDKKSKYNPNQINISCIGGLYPWKDQKTLIYAIAEVRKRTNVKLHVYIVGTGECEEQLKRLAQKLAITDIVTFTGYQKDTQKYYMHSQITVIPSKFEAFGRVTVEAMMSGSLVIGADNAGTAEIIDHNKYGLLFQVGDVHDLANQILYAINNPDLRLALAKKAKMYAMSEFSALTNAEKVYELYKEVCTEANR